MTNTNLFTNRNRLTENKLRVAEGRKGEGVIGEFGMDVCTLLYIKGKANRDRLSITWTSAPGCVAAWMEGEFEEMDTCMCMAESLCCAP